MWDEELVLCSALTGSTHVLDIAATAVVQTLMRGEARTEELLSVVSVLLETDEPSSAEVSALLSSLDELGIIEQVEGC